MIKLFDSWFTYLTVPCTLIAATVLLARALSTRGSSTYTKCNNCKHETRVYCIQQDVHCVSLCNLLNV